MEKQRKYARGLCPTCLFRYRCDYTVTHKGESVQVCDNPTGLAYMRDEGADPEETPRVRAKIVRDPSGNYRVMCQREKRKWWFELGRHGGTDKEFEAALAFGYVYWLPGIEDRTKLF